jgi:hypothetical protein
LPGVVFWFETHAMAHILEDLWANTALAPPRNNLNPEHLSRIFAYWDRESKNYQPDSAHSAATVSQVNEAVFNGTRKTYLREAAENFLHSTRERLPRDEGLCPGERKICIISTFRGHKKAPCTRCEATYHGRLSASGQSVGVGVPQSLKIRSSCSFSFLPVIQCP